MNAANERRPESTDHSSALDNGGLSAVPDSHLEKRLAYSPLTTQAAHDTLRAASATARHRPGEGPPTQLDGPVDWRGLPDDTHEETWGALVDFLDWALPRWGFTSEHVPARCWWQHTDIIEELTAWWGLWQACVRNPKANITDQSSFQERTHALKERLERSYRGRCRHAHQPCAELALGHPPPRGSGGAP